MTKKNEAERRSPFLTQKVDRLDVPGWPDLWVDVKHKLAYGEAEALTGTAFGDLKTGGSGEDAGTAIGMTWGLHAIRRILTYLTDWNFRDSDDRAVEITEDAIRELDPVMGQALDDLLNEHIERVSAEGNMPDGT